MLRIDDITYSVEGRPLFQGASATIPTGHKVGLVGRNGTGKTTLLRLILGQLTPDAGAMRLRADARLATVAQEAPGGEQSPLAVRRISQWPSKAGATTLADGS